MKYLFKTNFWCDNSYCHLEIKQARASFLNGWRFSATHTSWKINKLTFCSKISSLYSILRIKYFSDCLKNMHTKMQMKTTIMVNNFAFAKCVCENYETKLFIMLIQRWHIQLYCRILTWIPQLVLNLLRYWRRAFLASGYRRIEAVKFSLFGCCSYRRRKMLSAYNG